MRAKQPVRLVPASPARVERPATHMPNMGVASNSDRRFGDPLSHMIEPEEELDKRLREADKRHSERYPLR